MDSQERTLPDYDKPPVNEVVLGVQFGTLANFSAIHSGLFWQKIKGDYPKNSVHPQIAPSAETFEGPVMAELGVKTVISSTPPSPRYWFLDDSENQLIQLQSNRFLHNWRKMTGEEDYPHYSNILPEFKKQWLVFLDFIKTEELGDINLNLWEVTYVNNLYQGEAWNDLGDLYKVFPFLSNNALPEHLKSPEKIRLTLAYAYPDKLARLYVELATAYRRSDGTPLIQLKLTARGQLASNDNENLYKCLDFGRETIVKNFTDLTSLEAHKLWHRTL
ncbi:MAG: TIGR04255 family protein [Planctomycetes bacterium]|nr:TIGR04255 family protein [Planctomycetota bacterium]